MAKTDSMDELVRLLLALDAQNKSTQEVKNAAEAISEPPKDYIMVGAIDFGTTFSGYAFSFKSSKDDIRMFSEWGAGVGLAGFKAPTCVLTNKEGEFLAFGYEAEQMYANLDEDEIKDYCFYDRFKMTLHREKTLGRSTLLRARNGKTRAAIEVFSMAIRYLKSHLVDAVERQSAQPVSHDLIRWVITVPAIWSDASKQFMREAAFLAGVIKDVSSTRLLIALEPEAASLYCRTLDVEHIVCGAASTTIKMSPGVKYLVLDAGGGTLDVTAHQLIGDVSGRVRELYQASGGDLGGIQVDKNFVELLEKIFSKAVLDRYRSESAAGWLQFMCTFERIKRGVQQAGTSTTNIPIPFELGETYAEVLGKPLKRGMQQYQANNPGVRFNAGMLCLSNEVMVKLFRPVVNGIVDHMKTLMALDVMNGVTYLMMVGGFSDSPVLQAAIREALGSRLRIIIPHDASLCVIKGAVVFGHDPSLISTRVSRKTYGLEVTAEFDADTHDVDKKQIVDGVPHCMDIFRTLVTKGEEVEIGNTRSFQFSPLRANQTGAEIKIYSTERDRPKYVTDSGVSYHGNIHINLSGLGTNRIILVTLMFGGTEIHVHAKDGSCGADGHFATTRVQFMTE